jgi:hypothetical protein
MGAVAKARAEELPNEIGRRGLTCLLSIERHSGVLKELTICFAFEAPTYELKNLAAINSGKKGGRA